LLAPSVAGGSEGAKLMLRLVLTNTGQQDLTVAEVGPGFVEPVAVGHGSHSIARRSRPAAAA
jgi:hypothetical protein